MLKNKKETIYSLVKSLIFPFKKLAIILVFLMLLTALLESVGLAILVPFFEKIMGNNSSHITRIIDYPLSLLNMENNIFAISVLFLSIIFFKNLIRLLTLYFSQYLSFSMREKWISQINNHYLSQPYGDIIKFKQGFLINNLINIPTTVSSGLIKISEFLISLFMVIVYYLLILLIDIKATALISIIGIILYFIIVKANKSIALMFGSQEVSLMQEINNSAAENISAMRQIRTFSLEKILSKKLRDYVIKFRNISIKFEIFKAIPGSIIEILTFIIIFSFALIMYSSSPESLRSSIPLFTVFVVSSQRLLKQLNSLVINRVDIIRFMPSFELIKSIIDESNINDQIQINKKSMKPEQGDILFKNVTFAYNDEKIILDNVSFKIPKGVTTAIIGESGIGKSTLADLIIGLYSPNSGEIKINNTNTQNFNIINWKKNIGFVSQDNFLFHASILDNIRYGDLNSSEKDIINASKLANAHNFINKLPDGYETIVGDRGLLLSGGQKQRIAIARALVRDPDILIFDEATSALDIETEKSLLKDIFNISKGKTVIVISHRIETVKSADNLLKMENGKIFNISVKDL